MTPSDNTDAIPPEETKATPTEESSKAIRGSAALVAGRVIGIALSLVIQVAIVQALTKSEFGAFGFALSAAALAFQGVSLGTTKAVPRFLGLYDEAKDDRRFAGTLVFETLLIAGLGLAATIGAFGAWALFRDGAGGDDLALTLTAILIITAPQEAFDKVLEAFAATTGDTRTIFLRKHLLEPGLRLAAILLLIALDGSPTFLAIAYVVAGFLGTGLYLRVVIKRLRSSNRLGSFRRGGYDAPAKELFTFSVPLLSHDLVFVCINAVATMIVANSAGLDEVALYRAVFPLARMNQVVGWTFAVLFMPLAARFFARDDRVGMADAYWRTAAWLTVLTLPIFLVTSVFADPVVPTLFGDEYRDGATVLAVLSTAYYANQTLGFNTATLQTFGHLRWTIAVDVIAFATFLVAALLLTPPFGALGAAIAGAISLTVLNLGAQVRLGHLGIPLLEARFARVWMTMAVAVGACFAIAQVLEPGFVVSILITGVASLLVLLITRRELDVLTTFPALARVPIAERVFR